MTEMIDLDSASYRNREGLIQKVVSYYKARKYLSKFGKGIVIKYNTSFWITDNAVLEIDDNCTIQNYAFFQLTKPHPKVFVGKNTVIGRNSIVTAKNLIKIGKNVLVGSYVQIIDHNHGTKLGQTMREQLAEIGEVIIGNDVWIGAGVKILMNSYIGDGTIIGANAVVSGEIPPNAVAVGVPARIVKLRS